MSRASVAIAVVVTALSARPAVAQTVRPIPGRLELAAGLSWTGSQSLGSQDAGLTNGTSSTLRLFSSTSDLLGTAGFEGQVGIRITQNVDAFASISISGPQLQTRISNDLENSIGATLSESVRQYTVGGGALWHVPRKNAAARLRPFVTVGAGYLRQLHEGATVVRSGQSYDFGGGVDALFASRVRRALKAAGVRFDARAVVRTKGIAFDGRRTIVPAAAASLFVRF